MPVLILSYSTKRNLRQVVSDFIFEQGNARQGAEVRISLQRGVGSMSDNIFASVKNERTRRD